MQRFLNSPSLGDIPFPDDEHIRRWWQTFQLSARKRTHSIAVAYVAMYTADQATLLNADIKVNKSALRAAALIHDLDSSLAQESGYTHTEKTSTWLRDHGYEGLAQCIVSHPVHTLLDPQTAPQTKEAIILFLADKMVKQTVIGIDARFAQWFTEDLPMVARQQLEMVYPQVVALRDDVLTTIGVQEKSILEYGQTIAVSEEVLP